MSQALLAIHNILQNSNIFDRSRETLLFKPFGDRKLTQFSGFRPTSVSHLKVADGPKRSTNRNLKKIITIEYTKTVIFQLLWPLDISILAKRELIQCSIIKWIYF